MKKMNTYKATTLAIIMAAFGSIAAYAQDDEITSIDDFLEESANEVAEDKVASSNTNGSDSDNVTQLDELSVESDVEAEQVKQAKKMESVATIDAAEMQNTSKTISKAINSTSGVKVRKSGGMGSEGKINIRGFEGKNIKVLVNGNPVETQGNLGLDDIPIDQIADIEVYKGYVPARFATDGAGGAINIVTKKRSVNSIDASYSLSSFNTHKASVSASHLIDSIVGGTSLEIGLSGYFNHSDNDYEFTSPYMKGSDGQDTSVIRDHDHYTSTNVQAFANLNKAWFDQISLGVSYGATWKEVQGVSYRITETEMNSRSVGATFGLDKADLFIKGLRFGDFFSFDYSENKVIDTTKTHCRNWISCDTASKNIGELSSMGLPRLRTVEAYNFNDLLNLDYELFKKQFIYWNTLFRYYKEKPEDDFGSESVGFNIAGFPGKRISVTSGLSLENNFWKFQNMIGFKVHYMKAEISKGTYSALVEPTIEKTDYHDYAYDESLSFNVVEPLTLKASYQHSVRLPTPDELFGDGAGIGAAPGLKPEESDNINAGFSLDLQEFPLVARLRLDADAFYTYYKNRIHYMSSAQMSVPYFNMEPIRGWGYEGDVKLDVNEWVLLGTNWTFQDLRNIDYNAKQGIPKDAIIPNIPRFFMNFLAEFHMGDILNKNDFVKFWWAANYTDEYYYGWRVSSRQSRKIEASFSQDLGIEYSVWDNKLAWSFEVDNFMDETVYDKYGESKPGRTFATKIRYSFR